MNIQQIVDSIQDNDVEHAIALLIYRVPSPKLLNTPELSIKHVDSGHFWNNLQLNLDFRLANPRVKITKKDIQYTLKRNKVSIKLLQAGKVYLPTYTKGGGLQI